MARWVYALHLKCRNPWLQRQGALQATRLTSQGVGKIRGSRALCDFQRAGLCLAKQVFTTMPLLPLLCPLPVSLPVHLCFYLSPGETPGRLVPTWAMALKPTGLTQRVPSRTFPCVSLLIWNLLSRSSSGWAGSFPTSHFVTPQQASQEHPV